MWLQHPISHVLRKSKPFSIFSYSLYSASAATTYTFGSATLAYPRQDRKLIIAACGEDSATDFSITGITVDSVAATEVIDSANVGSFVQSALYIKDHPSGTTASIAVTFSEAILTCGIFVWCAYNLKSNTPIATKAEYQTASANIDLSIKTPDNGLVFAAGVARNDGGGPQTAVWNGLYNPQSLSRQSAANLDCTNQVFLRTIGCDFTGVEDSIGVSASFR